MAPAPRPPVAVLGLGLMGGSLARHLRDDGHLVVGFDPDADRVGEQVRMDDGAGFRPADTVADAVADTDTVLLSLPDGTVMLDVCRRIVEAGRAVDGLLVVDTTTGAPEDALAAAELLADGGGAYVDATISGNAAQAATRDVIFMVGGARPDVERATDLLGPLGRGVHAVGTAGSGSRAKLVVNHVLSINRVALAEGLCVAEKAGIDPAAMLGILRDSAAHSKAVDIWGERMVAGDHLPPNSRISQNLKDSRLINDHATAVGAPHDLVRVVLETLAEAERDGLAAADNSATIEVLRRRAGIGRLRRA